MKYCGNRICYFWKILPDIIAEGCVFNLFLICTRAWPHLHPFIHYIATFTLLWGVETKKLIQLSWGSRGKINSSDSIIQFFLLPWALRIPRHNITVDTRVSSKLISTIHSPYNIHSRIQIKLLFFLCFYLFLSLSPNKNLTSLPCTHIPSIIHGSLCRASKFLVLP